MKNPTQKSGIFFIFGLFCKLDGGFCRKARIVQNKLNVAVKTFASGEFNDLCEQERSGLLALDAGFRGLLESLFNGGIDNCLVHGIFLGNGVRDEHTSL